MTDTTNTPTQPEPEGLCTYGEDDGPGGGCIREPGHSGAHWVLPSEDDDALDGE